MRGALADGLTHVKMKVGGDLARTTAVRALRRAIGGRLLCGRQPGVGRGGGDRVDAGAGRGRSLVDRGADEPGRRARARADPGDRAVRVATGEHIQNRVVFKQLFQAEAIDACQLDACRWEASTR